MVNILLESDELLRDEVFLTIIKLIRNNPRPDIINNIWYIFKIIASSISPSENFKYAIYNYLFMVIDNHPEEESK